LRHSLQSIIERGTYLYGNGYIQKHDANVADRFRIDRRHVKRIFVDETLMKIDGQEYRLWMAYEPDLGKCLMMHLSQERTILACYQFFRRPWHTAIAKMSRPDSEKKEEA
jgi:transposase-like protein